MHYDHYYDIFITKETFKVTRQIIIYLNYENDFFRACMLVDFFYLTYNLKIFSTQECFNVKSQKS